MNIVMNRIKWEDFTNRLNNPTPENLESRRKFFEECDKLVVSNNGESVVVECPNLDADAIIAVISK